MPTEIPFNFIRQMVGRNAHPTMNISGCLKLYRKKYYGYVQKNISS
ncbi:MAG: hypothetical protein IJ143_07550 [Neisseriaceae bacterium]|nr:hypothetical protein [Neisseriaceae bacterium]